MLVQPNTEGTIEFLVRYRGSDPIVLTAIVPNGGPVESETFKPAEDVDRLRKWLDERQGKQNLYFTVNPTMKPLSGRVKARKEHMKGMTTLHVDLDPRAGEDLELERQRALRMISGYKPKPSVIIDSGGGFQGFWVLNKLHEANGSEQDANQLEAYNQQIAVVLAADACHNIDRIMRLPGTLNVPDEKKLKKGRSLALAKLVEYNEEVYDLSAFTPAVAVQSGSGRTGAGVKLSGNLPRADLAKLPDKVNAKLKAIIQQGEDPEDLTRFPSRSEALFYVCCELVRAGVDDDTIAAILMDRELAISASVLDKPRATEYAARQIQRAHEAIESPELMELNDSYAVIMDLGGKCRVISEVKDPVLDGRTRISRQSFEDFRNAYCNHQVQVGKNKSQPLGDWWLKHPLRRQYRAVVFAPNRTVQGVYNLWRGFSCEPVEGDCRLFLDHLRDNICSGNEEHFTYVLNWMARAVQQPDSPGQVALVLRGGRGTGKSFFAQAFGSLFASHFLQISDAKHLVGTFNAHLRDTVVLFADEAFYAGDKKHESILKSLVTESTFIVEGKGIDAETAPNYAHLIMASNDRWVVPAGEDERRFFVLDVGSARAQDAAYFMAIADQMKRGGRAALLHFLMSRDISSFEVRTVPQTRALREQKQLSQEPHEAVFLEMLRTGVTPDPDPLKDDPNWISVEGIVDAIADRRELPKNRHSLQTKVGLYLRKFVECDKNGNPFSVRVKRTCAISGGRLVGEVPEDYSGPLTEVRRTMYRLRPLHDLRVEHSHLNESWPAYPGKWTLHPEPPKDDDKVKAYELAMAGSRAA